MAFAKSHVVSVRVDPRIKAALQTAADREMRNLPQHESERKY